MTPEDVVRINKRTRVVAVIALLLLGAVGAFAVFGSRDRAAPGTDDPTLGKTDPVMTDADTGEAAMLADEAQKTPTESPAQTAARKRALAVRDTPIVPGAAPAGPAAPGEPAGPTPEELRQRYLDETKRVVETNAGSMAELAAEIAVALSPGDARSLGQRLAPDEGAQDAYLAMLASRYPAIKERTPASGVNVFSVNQATIYIAYFVVTWTDAGITSQHTIPIPMRFVDGRWYLTSLDDSTAGLQFVQAVQL